MKAIQLFWLFLLLFYSRYDYLKKALSWVKGLGVQVIKDWAKPLPRSGEGVRRNT